jgi:AAA family ATP:ADP antiporter
MTTIATTAHRSSTVRDRSLTKVDRVLRLFAPVRAREGVTALLLTVDVFVLLTCYYILKVVREPLILLGGGGAELKAYASAGQTLLLLAVVPAFGALASRVNRIRLLTTIQLVFIGCLVAFYVLAQAAAPIGLAFYLWLGIFNVLVISNFWSFANDIYDQDTGKRLFPILGVGASVGAILGALLPQRIHHLVGTYELMLVAAGMLVVSMLLYRVVDRRERRGREAAGRPATKPEAEAPVETDGGFALVIRDPYLRVIALMVLVATVINTTGEYVVSRMATEASAALPEAARGDYIRGFFSSYYGLVNLISALLQALLVSRLIKYLGVRRALLIMPLLVLGGWFGFFAATSIVMIRVTKTAENSVDYSLHNTLRQALYLPTSRAAKYKAKAATDTFFFRMGDVVAGLGIVLLLVHVLDAGVRAFAVVNIALAALWIVLAIRAGRLHDARAQEIPGPDAAKADAR